jgi:hypothetical protein
LTLKRWRSWRVLELKFLATRPIARSHSVRNRFRLRRQYLRKKFARDDNGGAKAVHTVHIRWEEDASGQFAHSNVITILNAQGEIVHQEIGLNQDIQETVRILRQLVEK